MSGTNLMRVRARRAVLWGVVGVVVLAGIGWLAMRGSTGTPWSSASPSPSMTATPQPSSSPKSSVTSKLSYSEAVKAYEGRRFQFDAMCQANPSRLAMNAGLSVMIDNRSGDARTFAVGGVFFSLPGYGWKVVTPSAKTLPANVYIDCGSSRNVGTIVLQ